MLALLKFLVDQAGRDMQVELEMMGEAIPLLRHQYVRIRHPQGYRVRALSGRIWITQDGTLRDLIVEAGSSGVLDDAGEAWISALSDARIGIDCLSGMPAALTLDRSTHRVSPQPCSA